MRVKMAYFTVLLSVLLSLTFNVLPLFADHFEPYNEETTDGWTMNFSIDHWSADLESTDQYLSGDEDWEVMHDLDGDLNGFSIQARPPIWDKRLELDGSYLSGDLKGSFRNREISPAHDGPYTGTVKFDREDWKIGADFFVMNAVYVRAEYYTFDMDGDWVYDDGSPNEPQEYKFDSYAIGPGYRTQNLQGKKFLNDKFGIYGDVFAGITFLNYEHTEKLGNVSTERDDVGYKLTCELLATYLIAPEGKKTATGVNNSYIYAGIGYKYSDSDSSELALTQKGFTGKLGVQIAF